MVVNDCQYGIIMTLNQTWFMHHDKYENASALYISPAISVNQAHTNNQASFWKYLRYFENLFMSDPKSNDDGSNDGGSDN
jgi:hypothetical protein